MTEGIVPIHGKQYKTVAYRVNEFRRNILTTRSVLS